MIRYGSDLKTFFSSALRVTHPAITCSNLTRETVEQGVKYIQS